MQHHYKMISARAAVVYLLRDIIEAIELKKISHVVAILLPKWWLKSRPVTLLQFVTVSLGTHLVKEPRSPKLENA